MVSMCILHSLCAAFDVVFNPGAIFAVFVQLSFSFPSPHHSCVSIGRFQLDRSLCPLFLLVSLSPPLFLWKAPTQLEPRRLKRGAWERRNKGPSVCSHHHSAPPLPPPALPSLGPLASLFPLSTGQRPKLRLQTRKWAH